MALVHDAVHRRQAEPGAFPLFLRGEERLEQMRPRASGEMPTPLSLTRSRTYASAAATSAGGATSDAGRRATSSRIQPPAGSASRAFSTRLRIACSICVGSILTQRRLVRHLAGERDVLANQPRQHALQPEDGLIEIDLLRQEHLLAAEGQQLLRERGRALPRLLDLLEGRSIGIVRPLGC